MLIRIVLTLEIDIEPAQGSDVDCVPTGWFWECYGMSDLNLFDDFVLLLYFSFTTLTTVGLGDFHPKSSVERIFISFFMLFGVAIFSVILNNLLEVFE